MWWISTERHNLGSPLHFLLKGMLIKQMNNKNENVNKRLAWLRNWTCEAHWTALFTCQWWSKASTVRDSRTDPLKRPFTNQSDLLFRQTPFRGACLACLAQFPKLYEQWIFYYKMFLFGIIYYFCPSNLPRQLIFIMTHFTFLNCLLKNRKIACCLE